MDTRSTDALRDRVTRLEVLVGGPTNDEDNNRTVFARLRNLDEVVERGAERPESSSVRVDDAAEMVENLRAEMEALRSEVTLLRRAVLNQPQQEIADRAAVLPGRLKVPEPMKFGGARSSKDLENFVWEIQEYFRAAEIPAHKQVSIASMFLTGDAKLWWRTRTEDGVEAGRPNVETWEDMRSELRDQFLPTNTAWVARDTLRKIRHVGTVRDYVKAFSSCLLDIKDMSESDKLYNFVSGLQPWAQMELKRQKVQDLQSALGAADALVDLKSAAGQSGDDRGSKEGKTVGSDRRSFRPRPKDKVRVLVRAEQGNSQDVRQKGCYSCGGPHRVRDCPDVQKGKMAAVQAEDDVSDSGEQIRISTLQLVGAPKAERPKQRGLGVTSAGAGSSGAGEVKLAALRVFEASMEDFPGDQCAMLECAEVFPKGQRGDCCQSLVEDTKTPALGPSELRNPEEEDQLGGVEFGGLRIGKVRVRESRLLQGVDLQEFSSVVRGGEFMEWANDFMNRSRDCKGEVLQRIVSKLYAHVWDVRQQPVNGSWDIRFGVSPCSWSGTPKTHYHLLKVLTGDEMQKYMRRQASSFSLVWGRMSLRVIEVDRVLEFVGFLGNPQPWSTGATKDLMFQWRIRRYRTRAEDGVSVEPGDWVALTEFSTPTDLGRQPLDEVSSCWANFQQCFTWSRRGGVKVLDLLATLQSLGSACSLQFLGPRGVVCLSCSKRIRNLEAGARSRWKCVDVHARSGAQQIEDDAMVELEPRSEVPILDRAGTLLFCHGDIPWGSIKFGYQMEEETGFPSDEDIGSHRWGRLLRP